MPSKLAILENVDMYTADELVGYIKSGIVTFDELCDDTDGCFPASVRKEVERKIAIRTRGLGKCKKFKKYRSP